MNYRMDKRRRVTVANRIRHPERKEKSDLDRWVWLEYAVPIGMVFCFLLLLVIL